METNLFRQMNMEPSFEKFLELLLKNQVKFIVCGGVAVGFCGFIRTTDDIDVLVSVRENNIKYLAEALSELGEGHGGEVSLEDMPLEPGCVRILEMDCSVDLFTLMDSKTYEEMFPSSLVIQLPQLTGSLNYLSHSQLISAKSSTGREKDRIDVDALQRLLRGDKI